MRNWKKIVLSDFNHWLEDDKYKMELLDDDKTVKEEIDAFMGWYEDSSQLIYINGVCKTNTDYKTVKKFLYTTFLDKYTDVLDFSNSDADKLWDL